MSALAFAVQADAADLTVEITNAASADGFVGAALYRGETGWLKDGTVFDSSVDRGQPASFGVTQVIQGWVEALQLMPEGSKWKLFIPYNLAYGERAAGAKIGPYSTLVFEVELLKIN